MITAPFNFVPLNEKVFFPPWAEDVSHDVPFEDGESGVIDITITAKSPIFIRDHQNPEQFCQHNGQYYIPGSSVKGMIRNVLEIMSFGKLDNNCFDDDTYAVRDLSSAQNFYMKQMNLIDEPITQCGWLIKRDNEYIIEDCGIPGRIHHKQIDYALNVDFASRFKNEGFEKTSEYKYSLVNNEIHTIKVGEKYKSKTNPKYDKREFYKYDKNGKQVASLILTGQPTPRKDTGKMGDGKGFEFLFFEKKRDLNVTNDVFDNFLFAYFNERTTEPKESPDWKYWKKKLYAGERVPVFFQKNGNKVLHFGLSYLYKLPYKHSIKDGLSEIHFDDRLDLAQTIFGYISKDNKQALKGRVQFSHFKAVENIIPLETRREILGTPRASYYPMYIRQYNTDFTTYMDSNFSIAGRKRYPIHNNNTTKRTKDTGNENVGTTFSPLADGAVFKGKLRYHNLKKSELGAIFSALTFHNTSNTFHNIGMAKSLGYGKIKIGLNSFEHVDEYLKEFELHITEQILDWKESVQLKELVSMSVEQNNSGNSTLKYMKLTEFANNKSKNKDFLKCYTELDNIQAVTINSLINDNDIRDLEIKNKKYLEEQKEFEKKKKAKQKEKDDWNKAKASNTIQAFENFIKSYTDSSYIEVANDLITSLKQDEIDEKDRKIQQEADEKWNKIHHPSNVKYLKNALNDFIEDYPKSDQLRKAKEELANLVDSTKVDTNTKKLDFSDANDIKSLERAMKAISNPSESDKKRLIEAIKIIYPTLNAKKKGQFKRSKLIPKWIGKDELENTIDSI